VNAARAAAEAEDPGRTFLAEHRTELSEEQQKALDWFATNEGEKALDDYGREKDEQKEVIRERALGALKVDRDVNFASNLVLFNEATQNERQSALEKSREILEEFNNQIIPALFREKLDGILLGEKSFVEKMEEIKTQRNAFWNGMHQIVNRKEVPPVVTSDFEIANKESYFYGLLAPSLLKEIWPAAADALDFSDRNYGVDFDRLVGRIGDRLGKGHENEKLNSVMESHNYVFNPKKNRYEKVEG